MRLFWNESFPDSLYMIGPDALQQDTLYVLLEVIPDKMQWVPTLFLPDAESLIDHGFEYIGEL